jgi:hypothetical protein
VFVNDVQQYSVGGEIAFPARSLEDLSVNFMIKIVIKQLVFLQALEDLVLPIEASS